MNKLLEKSVLVTALFLIANAAFAAVDCYSACTANDPACYKNCFIKDHQIDLNDQNQDATPPATANDNGGIQLGSVPAPQPTQGFGSPSLFDRLKSQPMQRGQGAPVLPPEPAVIAPQPGAVSQPTTNAQPTNNSEQPAAIFH